MPPQCDGNVVTGVSWDMIPWKERRLTTTWADVDVVGVLSGTGFSSTVVVEQIGPVGTFVVTSDKPAADLTMPAMACLRSLRPRRCRRCMPDGIETVAGYQAALGRRDAGSTWRAAADPAAVESQVRALGYAGPLCIGALLGPSHAELVAAEQPVVSFDGLMSISIVATSTLHIEVGVAVSTPAVVEQIQALVRSTSPTATVVVTHDVPDDRLAAPQPVLRRAAASTPSGG